MANVSRFGPHLTFAACSLGCAAYAGLIQNDSAVAGAVVGSISGLFTELLSSAIEQHKSNRQAKAEELLRQPHHAHVLGATLKTLLAHASTVSPYYASQRAVKKLADAAPDYCKDMEWRYVADDPLNVLTRQQMHVYLASELSKLRTEPVLDDAVWLGFLRELNTEAKAGVSDDLLSKLSGWIRVRFADGFVGSLLGESEASDKAFKAVVLNFHAYTAWGIDEIRSKVSSLSVVVGRLEELLALKDKGFSELHALAGQMPPVPPEASAWVTLINEHAGDYALALKAVVEGRPDEARRLCDAALLHEDATERTLRQEEAEVAARGQEIALKKSESVARRVLCYIARAAVEFRDEKYADAQQWCQLAVSLCPEDDRPLYLSGKMYLLLGKTNEALIRIAKALLLEQKRLKYFHPDLIARLNNFGVFLTEQGRYAEAEPPLRQALAMSLKIYREMHPLTATTLNSLATLYMDQCRLADAEPLYDRALAIREQVLGPMDPHTAASLSNLALLHQAQGRYDEVEPLFVRAVNVMETVLGASHPKTAVMCNNMKILREHMQKMNTPEVSSVSDENALGLWGGTLPIISWRRRGNGRPNEDNTTIE